MGLALYGAIVVMERLVIYWQRPSEPTGGMA
jgi:hypothetical protein